jgi:hypothetical protein
MLKVKAFEVYGQVINRNGQRTKTLTKDVEQALNDFLGGRGLSLEDVQVKQTVDFGGAASGGAAFITVLYEAGKDESADEAGVESDPSEAEGEETQEKPRRRGRRAE